MLAWARRQVQKLAAIPESPHEIAKAFAIGVFVGVLPGTGPAFALLAAFVLRLSKLATVLGSFTTNPWTFTFVYAASYKIGMWILPFENTIQWKTLYHLNPGWTHELWKIFPAVATGGAIVGLSGAVVSYGIVRMAVTHYKKIRIRSLSAQ